MFAAQGSLVYCSVLWGILGTGQAFDRPRCCAALPISSETWQQAIVPLESRCVRLHATLLPPTAVLNQSSNHFNPWRSSIRPSRQLLVTLVRIPFDFGISELIHTSSRRERRELLYQNRADLHNGSPATRVSTKFGLIYTMGHQRRERWEPLYGEGSELLYGQR